jgi:hypothetical protein
MSLILDSTEYQRSNEGVYLSIARGRGRAEPPPVRRAKTLIPFRSGRRPEPGYADTRVLELVGWIKKPDPAQLVSELDDLKALVDPRREPWILLDTLPNAAQRWARVVGRNLMAGYLNPHAYELSVELEADDPFWYSAYGTLDMNDGIEMDDDYFMDSGGEIIVVPPATEVTFDSQGTAEVERIRIRFVGPSASPIGVHNLSTESPVGFSIFRPLAAGEQITVNNYARTAKLDGATNVRGDMTLMSGNRHNEYLRLLPGSNTLQILGAPAEARITFFPTWL